MTLPIELIESDRERLLNYLSVQLSHFFPDGTDERPVLDAHLNPALERLAQCIEQVRMWTPGRFSYLHSSQYAIFLYYLANTIWKAVGAVSACPKLFGLNKALNAIDLFYEIEMPRVFFIGHSVGIVLAKAVYGEHLVLYQNATVGKNHGRGPTLGEGVILYPNSAVIGACTVGDRTVVAQGASLIDQDTPGHCLAFRQAAPTALIKPSRQNYLEEYFRGL